MGKITVNENLCKGCGMCVFACPLKIIALTDEINAKGYHPARCVQPEKCIGCCACAFMCPDVAITVEKNRENKKKGE
jgi:2-oxoglutarate ferredoxin oxidoreductase subunit delta